MRTFIIFLLISLLPAAALSQEDFVRRDSLVVTFGKKDHRGSADCSAIARTTSTDSTLVIQVDVTDDKLVLRDDPLQSDHVELWFAIPVLYDLDPNTYPSDASTSYLWDGDKQLYLFKGKADLTGFEREIRSPTISASNYGEDFISYDALDSLDQSWLKEEVDRYLAPARRSKLSKIRFFYCITHLGALPANNRTVLYDRENYTALERMIGAGIPDLAKFATCTTVTRPDGYSVVISLRAEAIGFCYRVGAIQMRFMVDVVDVDEKGKQETILSSSPQRRWGEPWTFKQLDLYPPIRVPLYSGFPEAGNPKAEDYTGKLPISYLPQHFLYTTAGWIPVEMISDPFNAYNRPEGFWMENINKVTFKRGTFDARKTRMGKDTLVYLNVSRGEFLFFGTRFAFPTSDTIATFLLADSSVAVLARRYEEGPWPGSGTSYLLLGAGSSEKILGELLNSQSIRFSNSLLIEAKDWDPEHVSWTVLDAETNPDWSAILQWEHRGRSIVIDLGKAGRIRISWDAQGEGVEWKKLESGNK